ncbi:MAG: bi-domain-containing oxidoreductase [Pyrinomonadaceae bacterium]
MKQILQNIRSGVVAAYDVPSPEVQSGRVLVRTAASLISAGTEKATVDSGKKTLLGKAKDRPDLVKQVIDKVRTEGLINTYKAVQTKLDGTTALGYSAAGIVAAVGDGVTGFLPGDRVACAGAGYASHAEVISVPQNLCVRLPDGVSFEDGAFGTMGAIALQGVRLVAPTLGEAVVVMGLGLLGLITVQLLRANGCRAFGIDLDQSRMDLALELGAERCSAPSAARPAVKEWSRGRGADAVLITAGTSSNEPIELAGDISRQKGRVVVVGAVSMDVPRGPYFSKELGLQISMSYGPGRYDPAYEERGHDYPYAYVRWTEGRNLEAFFDLAANKSIVLDKLISHRFPVEQGEDAYKLISGETKEPYLGIVLQYDQTRELESKIGSRAKTAGKQAGVRVGLIGAGGYARGMLLPHFTAAGAEFCSVATAGGLTARDVARQFGFAYAASGSDEVINSGEANLIVIATPHDTHAALAVKALQGGNHVFVEKPLALNEGELDTLLSAAASSSGKLMAGFNRRFSPAAKQASEFFAGREYPLSILYRVNAGRIPADSWIQDQEVGGGRIVGEVCHFIDLMQFLTGSLTTRVYAEAVSSRSYDITDVDSVFVTLKFADGSNGTIAYLAEGDKSIAKERVEMFGGGKTFLIDDFIETAAYAGGKETKTKLGKQDKGQAEEVRRVCDVVLNDSDEPIALDDLAATTRATFLALESLRTGESRPV